jgi:hypothetical protein
VFGRTIAMSTTGEVRSTRAGIEVPSDSFTVTKPLFSTTWALVTISSGLTKNPVPRLVPASIDTTAAAALPTISSNDELTAGSGAGGTGSGIVMVRVTGTEAAIGSAGGGGAG